MSSDTRKAYIYKLTSPSGKVYIGRTSNFEKRMKDYKAYRASKQRKLFQSLLKYGYEAHTQEIIFEGNLPTEELYDLEKRLIAEHDAIENGLNIHPGGSGFDGLPRLKNYRMPEKTKRLIAERRVGFRHSDESKRLMSLNNPMRVPEHKDKMIQQVKKAFTPELREHLSKKQKEIKAKFNPLSRKVVQLTLDGLVVREYKSTHEAANMNGTRNSNISAVCRGERKSHIGFIWRYAV